MGTVPEWIAAIGGVFALLAAIYAVLLQSRELRLQRSELQAQRIELERTVAVQGEMVESDRLLGFLGMQAELIKMAIDNPALRRVHGEEMDAFEGEAWERGVYINLWFRLYRADFVYSDGVTEPAIRSVLRGEYFNNSFGIEWWGYAASRYESEVATELDRKFVEIVNDEWERAVAWRSRRGSAS